MSLSNTLQITHRISSKRYEYWTSQKSPVMTHVCRITCDFLRWFNCHGWFSETFDSTFEWLWTMYVLLGHVSCDISCVLILLIWFSSNTRNLALNLRQKDTHLLNNGALQTWPVFAPVNLPTVDDAVFL